MLKKSENSRYDPQRSVLTIIEPICDYMKKQKTGTAFNQKNCSNISKTLEKNFLQCYSTVKVLET